MELIANLFLLKSQTISQYVYWAVTTQVRHLVQTNSEVFPVLVSYVWIWSIYVGWWWCVRKKDRWSQSHRYQCGFLCILLCQMFPKRRLIFYIQCQQSTAHNQCNVSVLWSRIINMLRYTWSKGLVSWVNWVSSASK